ncbi:hypothetical protein C1645_811776 [Glomus cerebriforme]|uniref:Galactose oxidase n=1 Tax=Glomus cerebriforme TaxID=658196 RepID=A0A397TMU2_9GLOM|nr:hypothetical protein C1645_811776 [Glomus cerebriforme]
MILLNIFLINIIVGILFQLLIEVKSQITNVKPSLRNAHTATFINDKLYILGGVSTDFPNGIPNPPFLYLDVSNSFDTNNLEWHDLTNINNIPPSKYAAAIKGGANNSTLIIYGGQNSTNLAIDLVDTFDTQNNIWNTPNIPGIPPSGKVSIIPIVDYNGLMYLFGGYSPELSIYTNEMFVLDTINLSWKNISSINAPSARVQYGAVFLPNNIILYMGGYNQNVGPLTLNEVYLFDTINDIWTTKITYGSIPSPRYSFSSVLGLDGQSIIIYGGSGHNNGFINQEDSVYVLNINNFNWYIPKISGQMPSSRTFHKSVLIGNYMVITFGEGYTPETESDILLLDISNNEEYVWTKSFNIKNTTPFSPLPSTGPNPNPSSSPAAVIVGAIIGSVIGIAITIGSFFLYKWRKHVKKQDDVLPTSGDEEDQKIIQIPSEKDSSRAISSDHSQEILLISGNTKSSVQQNVDPNSSKNEAISEVIVQK